MHTLILSAVLSAAATFTTTVTPEPPQIGTAIEAVKIDRCTTEDAVENGDVPCVWDAQHMGNGKGRSFIVTRHRVQVHLRHDRAHCMIRPHTPTECLP